MSQRDNRRDNEPEYHHHGCGAVVSIGAYGNWHVCEACEVETDQHPRWTHPGACTLAYART